MTLIVEDGTGKSDAESYGAVADAIAYLSSRGKPAFVALATANQEIALRCATDYLVAEYRNDWAGQRYSITQLLDWPRSYVPIPDVGAMGYGTGYPAYVPFDIVPLQVVQACFDLAERYAATGDLAPDVKRVKRSVKVGPIAIEYEPDAPYVTVYTAVANKLAPFLANDGYCKVIRT
jgi:hypothetical protein